MKSILSRLVLAILATSAAHAASRLTNVSVRSTAGSGADTLIVGFTVAGSGTKPVLIRGIGPTLGEFGVTGVVTDPELRVFSQANVVVAENDNWGSASTLAAASASVGAFVLPVGSADAALLAALPAGSYSAHLAAKSGAGTALVEAYDLDASTAPMEITNVSARSFSGTGAAVLTVGFSITGDTTATVLIRAVGPTLGNFGVTGVLANPRLQLFGGTNVLLSNEDWLPSAGWAAAFSAVGAFELADTARDAALLVKLPPGSYTAQASGAPNTTGVALIEVYAAPNPPASSIVFELIKGTGVADPMPRITPTVLTQARPQYPFELRRAGISGEVVVDFYVDANGRVVNAYPARSSNNGFNDAAVAAVRQWTFRPGLNAGGEPVATHMQVPIVFTLN